MTHCAIIVMSKEMSAIHQRYKRSNGHNISNKKTFPSSKPSSSKTLKGVKSLNKDSSCILQEERSKKFIPNSDYGASDIRIDRQPSGKLVLIIKCFQILMYHYYSLSLLMFSFYQSITRFSGDDFTQARSCSTIGRSGSKWDGHKKWKQDLYKFRT